ncbi:uncharacterized protein [Littorina saxatilis]|uniref:uncharacterized protein isoform X2 n=1 Tax=Littorina saxatilis TaxID=31220 RepID=UPI0038B4911B
MAKSQVTKEHLSGRQTSVCPKCGHDNHACSQCGYELMTSFRSVKGENVAGDVHAAKRVVMTIAPQSDEAVGILKQTPSGDCTISTVSNLILTQHHTTIKIDPQTKPVKVHIASNAEELQSATDGVMILRADWSDTTISGEQAQSSQTTDKSETPSEEREVIITRLINKQTEEFFVEVMKVIQREDLPEKIMKDLYQRFQLRLLGLTKRLEFLMEVDRSRVLDVMQLEGKIQEVLAGLVPRHRRQEVTWESFSHVPVQCSEKDEGTVQAIEADSGTARPQRAFTCTLSTADDTGNPYITAIVASDDNKLYLADRKNSQIKVVDLDDPKAVSSFATLQHRPWGLARLPSGLLAVTTGTPTIYLISSIEHLSNIETRRNYWGIAGNTDDTIIVSCRIDIDMAAIASVDIITLDGVLVKTLVDNNTLPSLEWPDYLCVGGDSLYVADSMELIVWKVRIATGELQHTLTDVGNPRQITVDISGNLYIANSTRHGLMMETHMGKLEEVLHGPEDSEEGQEVPRAVCVTDTLLVVVWQGASRVSGVVTGHRLR